MIDEAEFEILIEKKQKRVFNYAVLIGKLERSCEESKGKKIHCGIHLRVAR